MGVTATAENTLDRSEVLDGNTPLRFCQLQQQNFSNAITDLKRAGYSKTDIHLYIKVVTNQMSSVPAGKGGGQSACTGVRFILLRIICQLRHVPVFPVYK